MQGHSYTCHSGQHPPDVLLNVLPAVQQPQLLAAQRQAVLVVAAAGTENSLELGVVVRVPAACGSWKALWLVVVNWWPWAACCGRMGA